ncbi:MAG: DUF4918 family protein [Flavobacteriales bacterium]|jgi:hypothetical protein|nr:DUF4918 family protein [Flavobacteriales bacterium]MBT3964220.1 DUF4918 family protein [Flavobacteriales bacterium]MBT4704147.1 DUF4918 family protein [Flavobacteriales bacterium]MBT4930033.1 DUF4918 family protein [Flavobacteriales bacterium]MBT5132407.1 DUF4918 family protein [Flavobacteriales bacterium]
MKWSDSLYTYFESLEVPNVPSQYDVMNPYQQVETMQVVKSFLTKYYDDEKERTLLFGINPGRFGSGVTGISFTDPVRLKSVLNIEHDFDMRAELSSQFIFEVIEAYGANPFFQNFFISAVYPLGFLYRGKNINYYELEGWKDYMIPLIEKEIEQHLKWPVNRTACVCIGKGANWKFLKALNDKNGWFDEVKVLPHPRWILQYRRRFKDQYLDEYLQVLHEHRNS